jgi:hypothetical protein
MQCRPGRLYYNLSAKPLIGHISHIFEAVNLIQNSWNQQVRRACRNTISIIYNSLNILDLKNEQGILI